MRLPHARQSRPASDPDGARLRGAARSVGLQIGLAVALVAVAVAVVAYFVIDHQQTAEARHAVASAALRADDVTDPPPGVILLKRGPAGRVSTSAGAPAGLLPSAIAPGASTVRLLGRSYQAYAADRADGTRVVALADFQNRLTTDALLWPLAIAAVIGIIAATAVGGLAGRRAVRPLGAALAIQRRFVADASHELRTPLTVLHTRTQMLERTVAHSLDAELRQQVGELVADTRSLGEVVNDLLLSAELTHHPDRSEPVNITDLAGAVVRSFGPQARARGVDLRVASLPAAPAVVSGIPAALRRALMSLVDNAIAHEHRGGVVTISVRTTGTDVAIAVRDDGDGLDPTSAHELLHRFVRASSGEGHDRRFGLGLALVDEVMRAHGGTIQIDGAPGVGACFTLVLPRTDAPEHRSPEHSDQIETTPC
ncbi:MAG: sensor histidine kinase [Pseudonocardiales bacterium]|nr:MAG: sensor histidine kinase [Pseudonocardiales bacterium]